MKLIKFKESRGYNVSLNINMDYALVDVLDTNIHDDVSDVDTWLSIVHYIDEDYIRMRDFAKLTFIPQWSNFTDAQKIGLITHLIYPTSVTQIEIDALISSGDQLKNWVDIARNTKVCREQRWEVARQKVSFYLTDMESLDLYRSTKEYSNEYKDANIPSLIFWINSSAYPPLGIDFTSTGFSQKSYYTTGLRDLLLDIIYNGNYSFL